MLYVNHPDVRPYSLVICQHTARLYSPTRHRFIQSKSTSLALKYLFSTLFYTLPKYWKFKLDDKNVLQISPPKAHFKNVDSAVFTEALIAVAPILNSISSFISQEAPSVHLIKVFVDPLLASAQSH